MRAGVRLRRARRHPVRSCDPSQRIRVSNPSQQSESAMTRIVSGAPYGVRLRRARRHPVRNCDGRNKHNRNCDGRNKDTRDCYGRGTKAWIAVVELEDVHLRLRRLPLLPRRSDRKSASIIISSHLWDANPKASEGRIWFYSVFRCNSTCIPAYPQWQ